MPKNPKLEPAQRAVIALLLLFVLWCGWQSILSSQNSGTSAQEPSTTAASKGSKQNKQEIYWWQDATADFTLGLIFVGAAQVVLFYVQLKLIREGLVGAKEAADAAKEAANAAKVSADHVPRVERACLFLGLDVTSRIAIFQKDVPDTESFIKFGFRKSRKDTGGYRGVAR